MAQRLIDTSYFNGETFIPGVEGSAISDVLVTFINKYEPDFLNKVLGVAFAKEVLEGLAATAENAENQWTRIVFGDTFTHCNTDYLWRGLKNSDTKDSVIARYVYKYYAQSRIISQTTSLGESAAKMENSERVAMTHKLRQQWNELCDTVCELWAFLINKKDENGAAVYPSFSLVAIDKKHFQKLYPYNI